MAYGNFNYQYETSPRKIRTDDLPNTKQNKKKKTLKKQKKHNKKQVKPKIKTIMYILAGFAILFAISYRNSLITASFNERENLKKQLSTLQKENAQIEINIQTSLNLSNIEKSATQMLGMKKLDDSQKVYVSLPKKDYVEVATEQIIVEEEKSWIETIIENILDFIN